MKNANSTNAKVASIDDDYVWDVFYHRPATLSEWNDVSNVGTVYVEAFSVFIICTYLEACSTGLPASFGDTYDSASDSEEELDEADEDSNGILGFNLITSAHNADLNSQRRNITRMTTQKTKIFRNQVVCIVIMGLTAPT